MTTVNRKMWFITSNAFCAQNKSILWLWNIKKTIAGTEVTFSVTKMKVAWKVQDRTDVIWTIDICDIKRLSTLTHRHKMTSSL